ncbi:MAG: hypothetical protein A2289_02600 [Deltaproteobacteria bacterium RIFOXYA12_FULL_58_15]|nr:MAG: hypothetical protein A2289_02600 [Deltaproteobacteria bacterium RIFOXYA12_FULL_58_15]OGR11091.1 MAG: hypothetical protein A2341_07980 [Deltaproteobacteria bacterium RIFOXYB12_FULL_58_9]
MTEKSAYLDHEHFAKSTRTASSRRLPRVEVSLEAHEHLATIVKRILLTETPVASKVQVGEGEMVLRRVKRG